jgi:hypothetical protein
MASRRPSSAAEEFWGRSFLRPLGKPQLARRRSAQQSVLNRIANFRLAWPAEFETDEPYRLFSLHGLPAFCSRMAFGMRRTFSSEVRGNVAIAFRVGFSQLDSWPSWFPPSATSYAGAIG